MILWVLIGIVLVVIIWALVSAYSGKAEQSAQEYTPPPPPPTPEFIDDTPKAQDWKDAAKTSVSKNFGKGGAPSGVSRDSGGLATAKQEDEDEWLRNARPFEPRATKLDLDEGMDEAGETA